MNMAVRDLPKAFRNRSASTPAFRRAVRAVAPALLCDLARLLKKRKVRADSLVFVVVLRAGVALLDAALEAFPSAPVAVVGLRRDEKTARARWYYENLPPLGKGSTLVILDPMLATGGTAAQVMERLVKRGANAERIYFVGVVAAPEGVKELARRIPEGNLVVRQVDQGLDARKYIVPGLGDFGDRYFGYER